MRSSRETLLRLHRFRTEEKRRQVADIEAMIAELMRKYDDLDAHMKIEEQRTGLREDIEDVQRELRDLKQMVDVLGPAALGTQRILVHWAAQTGGLRVSEDELLSEGRLVADEEWQGQLAERGLFSPGALTGKLEG